MICQVTSDSIHVHYFNDLWFVCLQQIRQATKTDVVEPRLAALLDRISEYSNIPRKKAKFQVSDNVTDVGAQNGAWQISLDLTGLNGIPIFFN